MIYTSNFASVSKITNAVPIGIVRYTPKWWTGLNYSVLAPNSSILFKSKQGEISDKEFEAMFKKTLDSLNFERVHSELNALAKGKDIVLLCYEKIGDACHRHYVAEWFRRNGVDVNEFNAAEQKLLCEMVN